MKGAKRILAIDLGARRIGLAATDALGLAPQGLPTLRRANRRADLARIQEVVVAMSIELVVVGHPVHLKGHAGERAREAERFAGWLRRELKLPVELFDERLTSWEAAQVLKERGDDPRDKEAVDRVAASLLLQSYLEHAALRQREPARAAPDAQ
jgi:putative Holliday junction resolvase